jgi:hypothetical protein
MFGKVLVRPPMGNHLRIRAHVARSAHPFRFPDRKRSSHATPPSAPRERHISDPSGGHVPQSVIHDALAPHDRDHSHGDHHFAANEAVFNIARRVDANRRRTM